jgi:hypothetical protein
LFTKCFDEARRRKRQTANIRDFVAVVSQEDSLRAMLGQFLASPGSVGPPLSDHEAAPEEEEHDEPDAPEAVSEIEDILRQDSSDDSD